MDLSFLYYILQGIGFLLIFVPNVTIIAQHKKLTKEDFAAQIFTPNLIGLFCMGIGFYGALKDSYEEFQWQILITVTAAGAAMISFLAAWQSIVLIRWRAD